MSLLGRSKLPKPPRRLRYVHNAHPFAGVLVLEILALCRKSEQDLKKLPDGKVDFESLKTILSGAYTAGQALEDFDSKLKSLLSTRELDHLRFLDGEGPSFSRIGDTVNLAYKGSGIHSSTYKSVLLSKQQALEEWVTTLAEAERPLFHSILERRRSALETLFVTFESAETFLEKVRLRRLAPSFAKELSLDPDQLGLATARIEAAGAADKAGELAKTVTDLEFPALLPGDDAPTLPFAPQPGSSSELSM